MNPEKVVYDLGKINVCDICDRCQNNGCINADDQHIPCEHMGVCACDDHCVCECHEWDRTIKRAQIQLETLIKFLGVAA